MDRTERFRTDALTATIHAPTAKKAGGVPVEWSGCYASWGWLVVAHWLAYSIGVSSPRAVCGLLVL